MSKNNCGCQVAGPGFPGGSLPSPFPQCASTSTATPKPCAAPSYARACIKGDPSLSPLRIERAARAEHLWTRTHSMIAGADLPLLVGVIDVVFPAFTSAGTICLTGVSLSVKGVAVPVDIVGISAVWDFTDSSPDWTARVAIPCEVQTLDILTTTGRCPCKVECEGCIYPAGVGGLFAVRFRFATVTLAPGDGVKVMATGEFNATEPCCTMPEALSEPVVVSGPYPAVQFAAA